MPQHNSPAPSSLVTFIVVTALLGHGVAFTVGCHRQVSRDEKPVHPLTGTVLIDGKPVADVQVSLHNVDGVDSEHPTYPQGFTKDQGQIEISTYASGDGAPEGEYRATFVLQAYDPIAHSFGGKDRLGGKYANPDDSNFLLVVGPDAKNDLGTIQLTTKPSQN